MLENGGVPWGSHVRPMSWQCLAGSSVLGCLRSRHTAHVCQTRIGCMPELEYHYYETGLSWATIPNGIRNDSLLLRGNQPQQQWWEKHQARHTFLAVWCWLSRYLASTFTHLPCWEILGTVRHQAGGHLGQVPAPHQSALLGVPCFSSLGEKDWKKNLQSPFAAEPPGKYCERQGELPPSLRQAFLQATYQVPPRETHNEQ